MEMQKQAVWLAFIDIKKNLVRNEQGFLFEKRRLPILPTVNRKYFRRKRA